MAWDPITPSTAGWGPHKQNASGKLEAAGPFFGASANRDQNGNTVGYSIGGGLMSGQTPKNDARADVFQAQGHVGGWRDEQGRSTYGIEGDAALVRFGIPMGGALGDNFGFDVDVMSANAGAKANEETASLGAQANIISGSMSAGTQEHNIRGGLSLGVGLAGRVHYGDADGDGVQEFGLGGDYLFGSADIKTELLGHAWNGVKGAGNWVGEQAGNAWNSITSW